MTARRSLLLLIAALAAVACDRTPPAPLAPVVTAPRAAPSFVALSNLVYPLSGTAPDRVLLTLTDGSFVPSADTPDGERLVAEAELEALHAIGDLDSDGSPDAAVVLAWSGGGSGTFYELFAVLNESNGLRALAGMPLGDRIDLKSIAVQEGRVRINYVGAGPDDAACCPSRKFEKAFAVNLAGQKGAALVEVPIPGASL